MDQSLPFISSNVEGISDDNAVFCLSISLSIPKIFAIEIQSCQKLRQILDVFLLQKF